MSNLKTFKGIIPNKLVGTYKYKKYDFGQLLADKFQNNDKIIVSIDTEQFPNVIYVRFFDIDLLDCNSYEGNIVIKLVQVFNQMESEKINQMEDLNLTTIKNILIQQNNHIEYLQWTIEELQNKIFIY